MTRNTLVRWYSAVQGSPALPCRRRTVLTVCQRLSLWVMVGSDTIVVIRYLMMKVMLAPKYKAPGGFAPIFPDTCYHLTHYWPAAVDIPVASDNPVHYADA
ncbi:hypothetical protein MU771_20125, partial [Salmonella enterica subsp. enterica serovar Enteritidis]|nr:hypothetical protein [Salmonella enterica subsp. enterica serovar Enteritidis]